MELFVIFYRFLNFTFYTSKRQTLTLTYLTSAFKIEISHLAVGPPQNKSLIALLLPNPRCFPVIKEMLKDERGANVRNTSSEVALICSFSTKHQSRLSVLKILCLYLLTRLV